MVDKIPGPAGNPSKTRDPETSSKDREGVHLRGEEGDPGNDPRNNIYHTRQTECPRCLAVATVCKDCLACVCLPVATDAQRHLDTARVTWEAVVQAEQALSDPLYEHRRVGQRTHP